MQIRISELLTQSELEAIHRTSMKLLAEVGVEFYDEESINLFRRSGALINKNTVTLSEKQVMDAVASAPKQFTIRARNPRKSVQIGDAEPVFVPGYGAPFIMDETGRREPTMQDYKNLIRLVDALPNQDMSGYLLAQPGDVPPCQAYLLMLYYGMSCSDKPFMGNALDRQGASQTLEMASILFGESPAAMADHPVTLALVDSLSPLQYSANSAGALIIFARQRQPLIIASLVMAGATGPATLAGVLAQQNAEILAGLTLAQLVSPGTPVIYGGASTIMDLRTGTLSAGCPEMALLARGTAQLARFYGLPSRAGGGLTDSHGPDAQAGFESMLGLLTAVNSDIDLILHACGLLSSFLAVSYEKFVLDDELCGLLRHYRRGLPVTEETLAFDVIANVGPGGNFLEETHTFEHCRSVAWQPVLCNREGIESSLESGRLDIAQRARQRWQNILIEHEPSPLDKTTARQLLQYVEEHSC